MAENVYGLKLSCVNEKAPLSITALLQRSGLVLQGLTLPVGDSGSLLSGFLVFGGKFH